MTRPLALVVHKPGPGGLYDSTSLCGERAESGRPLAMHEWDYTCIVCREMSGEKTT